LGELISVDAGVLRFELTVELVGLELRVQTETVVDVDAPLHV